MKEAADGVRTHTVRREKKEALANAKKAQELAINCYVSGYTDC